MTKQNFVSINAVIDRSGSMAGLVTDTIGGYNTFLKDQKEVEGEAQLTLCLFNNECTLIHDCMPLNVVPNLSSLTYSPNGGTALLDALGTTIDTVGAKLAAMPEEERPSKVIVLVITDGQENSSKKFTKDQIKAKIEHQRDVYSWEFVFMGANIDAVGEGTSLGISAANSVNYSASSVGTAKLFKSVSENMGTYRSVATSAKVDFFNQTKQGLGQASPPSVVTTTVTTTLTPPVVETKK